jgi:hypothetical protein
MSILNNEKEKNIIQMTEENKIAENKNNNIPKKKHVSFTKPCYEIIDVESYKKYNEDISETRFYYISENKPDNNDHVRANCTCSVF